MSNTFDMFRFSRKNIGCTACLDNDRHSHLISTNDLFFRTAFLLSCKECDIYKVWQELQEYKERYEDDGK